MELKDITREDLEKLLKEEPTLGGGGFSTRAQPIKVGYVNFDEFLLCCKWLMIFKRTKQPKYSSYALKHDIENLEGVYIANGSVIASALFFNMTIKRNGINADLPITARLRDVLNTRGHKSTIEEARSGGDRWMVN